MFVRKIIELLESINISNEDKNEIRTYIEENQDNFSKNPRDNTIENQALLRIILFLLHKEVESRYGESENIEIYPQPILWEYNHSQICPLKDDNNIFGLGVASFAKTWEQIFYEISHESVHLLNPIIDVKNKKISTIEEGVAVKFAEEIYSKYISSYTKKEPDFSPTQDIYSQYNIALQAVKKIPDPILKKIRENFGKFSNIDDLEKFKNLVLNYINEVEVGHLYKPFIYPTIP